MKPEVIRTKAFVQDAANFIVNMAQDCLAARKEFRIALSGGNTPRPVYAEIARRNLPWGKIIFSFGDERCVPPDDDQSNYRMAKESLFEPAKVPDESILRMKGELDPPVAAQEYEEQLTNLAKERGEQIYRHDLVLLGLGEDGHTASLFPGTAALDENERQIVANFVPRMNTWRLTATYSLLNQARQVCFLVNSNKHADLIERVLQGDRQYPAAGVQPASGKLTWILGQMA